MRVCGEATATVRVCCCVRVREKAIVLMNLSPKVCFC